MDDIFLKDHELAGSQYLIAVNEPETIEDTHPYENMWIKSKNLTLFANTTAIRK